MSETMANPAESPGAAQPWDPFQLMDRMDEAALKKELEGVASTGWLRGGFTSVARI